MMYVSDVYVRSLPTAVRLVVLIVSFQVVFLGYPAICAAKSGVSDKATFYMAINRPEGTPLFQWTELIYTEVFRRLDMNLLVEYYPLKRASVQANKGKVDGEPARIYSYGNSYQNLIRIEESVFSMDVVAYAVDPTIPVLDSWSSLENSGYTVEFPNGMKVCENALSHVLPDHQILSIKNSIQGLERLLAKRTDLYIDDLNSTTPIIENEEYGFKNKVRVAGVMGSAPLYMYIHKSHRNLKAQLERTIKELKAEGLIEEYRKRAFGL